MIAVRERYRHIARYYDRVYRVAFGRGSGVLLRMRVPQAGERVLEVGTGTGFSYRYYPPDVDVTAIDLCPEMLAIAAKKTSRARARVRVAVMDAHALALRDAVFDIVLFPHSLGLMHDPASALSEVARVTRAGAELRILHTFVWRNPWLRRIEMALYDRFEESLGWGRPLEFERTIAWCRKNGFELERRRRLGWKTILCFRRSS